MAGPKLVVLISGGGTNLQALIDALRAGELPAEIAAVISNRGDAYGLQRAAQVGIPTRVVDHRHYPDRPTFDRALLAEIEAWQPALVPLAGFMRVLTADFVTHFRGRLLNIHPSLLPRHRGLDTHRRALQAGDREHGASVHFVTPELDGGPVVLQARVPVKADDDEATLAARVLTKEHVIYPLAVRWVLEGRLVWQDGQVLYDSRPLAQPLQLDELDG